jgi:Rrf2 family protein
MTMRLSTAGRYALRAMVDLALHAGEGPILRKDIAERQEISLQYLSQLLRKLKQAGLVDSVKGPGGGYVLTREASQIRAIDVLRGVEENITPVYCVAEEQIATCPRVDGCPTHWLWKRLDQVIYEVLDSVTLTELCEHSYSSI